MKEYKLKELIETLFSSSSYNKLPLYVDRYAWVLNLFLIVLLGWAMSLVMTNAVRANYALPSQVEAWTPPQSPSQNGVTHPTEIAKIEERDIFKAKVEEAVKQTEEVVAVPIDIIIVGIIQGPGWAFATIKDNKSGKQKVLGVGDELEPGIKLAEIEPLKIVFERSNGAREEFNLSFANQAPKNPQQGAPPPQQAGGPDFGKDVRAISETEFVIDKAGFQAALQNINELMTQARLTPAFSSDRKTIEGYRVFSVRPGSLFQKLGIRNGDIIQRLNGVALDDPKKGLELFQMLKDQGNFTIDLKRGGDKKTFSYEVK